MARDSCRLPSCDNDPEPDGDAFSRRFCSTKCELKFEHIRDDALDAKFEAEREARERREMKRHQPSGPPY